MEHYDLVVIGSGPAGRRAAIQAAKFGYNVLVVERGRRVGGVSVHTGTIPSKTLRETVLNLTGWRERGFYGRSYRVKEDLTAADLRARLHITLNHEVEVLEHQFARNKVDTIRGEARFIETRLSDPPALPPPPPPSCRVSAAVCSQLSTAAGAQEAGPPARGEVASCRPCGVCSSACDKYK